MQNFLKTTPLVAVALCIFIGLFGCGGGNGPVSPGQPNPPAGQIQPGFSFNNVVLPDTTKVFGESENNNLLSISPNGELYTFSSSSVVARMVQPGDIIIGVKGDGFLRKVKIVDGASRGHVTFTTEPATLEEAVTKASFTIDHHLTPDEIRQTSSAYPGNLIRTLEGTNEGFYYKYNNLVVLDIDGNPGTTYDQVKLDGTIYFDPSFHVHCNIDWNTLKEMTFYVETNLKTTTKAEVGYEVKFIDKKVELARHYFSPIYFQAGPLPVIITPILTINLGIKVTGNAGVETSVTTEVTYKAGCSYQDGVINPISEFNITPSWEPPHFSLGGKVKPYVGPELSFLLYGVVGPYVEGDGYFELDIDFLRDPLWELYAGFEVSAGVKLDIPWVFSLEWEYPDLIGYRARIAYGGPPTNPGGGGGQIDPTFFPSVVTFVGIVDKNTGEPILGLDDPKYWIVKEYPHSTGFNSGVPASIDSVRYVGENEPGSEISVVLCLDRSGSMDGQPNADLVVAANSFVDLMKPIDLAEIINFDDGVYVDQTFTSDKDLLKTAVSKYYGGNTALYDAIYRSIEDGSTQTGRKAVIAMTDGNENASSHSLYDISNLAQQALVPVYTVGLGSVNQPLLQSIADGTGGMFYYIPSSSELTTIYQTISGSLANQIRIEYLSPYPVDTTPDTQREVWVYLTNYPPYTDSGDIEVYHSTYWK